MKFITILKDQHIALDDVPVLSYTNFFEEVEELLQTPQHQLESYFGLRERGNILLFCSILRPDGKEMLGSFSVPDAPGVALPSIGAHHPQALPFEQRLAEYMGLSFSTKPVESILATV